VIASQRTRQMNVMWSVSANMHTPLKRNEQTPFASARCMAMAERVCFAATALYELIISAALARIIQRAHTHSPLPPRRLIYMLIWRAARWRLGNL
jgi:hypothetical protein